MSIQAAPRQVKYTKPAGLVLRVMDDYVPLVGAERPQYDHERWRATQGASPDRDWTGKGVGCYHGTDNQTGRAILCEGRRCKMLPRERTTRTNARNRPENVRAIDSRAARANRTDAVTAYIRSLGHKGTITPRMRRLAEESLEFARQVADMGAAA